MEIREIEDEEIVVIDNKWHLEGEVCDEKCEACNSDVILSFKYDSKYCPNCNKWLEKTCDDKNCQFCSERPEKPLY